MAAKNRIVRSIKPGSIFESAKNVIDTTISFEQGDLMYFDDTANLIKKVTSDANAATFLGIATQTVVNGKYKAVHTTDVDASVSIDDINGPVYGVIAKMKLKVGDAFNPGDLVYVGSDAQEVSSSGTKAIGVYQGKVIAAAVSGDEGEILLGHRFPGDVLVIG